jgi:hypothetical protein
MKNYIKNNEVDFATIPYKAIYLCETIRDDNWKCDAWNILIDSERFDFFTGLGHRSPMPKPADGGPMPRKGTLMYEQLEAQRKPQAPKIEDVLYSLILDSSALDTSFEYWCDDFGYDTDSIKALNIYQVCCENAKKIKRLFDSATIAAMREFFRYY